MPANLLGLRENPFAAGHDPRLILETSARAEIVARFRHALGTGEPFILVTGESGVGKTSVITQALAEEKAWSALITNPLLTRSELLEEICLRFGVDLPESGSKPRLLAELERHLTEIRREGEIPVLVIDEAHDLSLELLEELRLLSNLEFKSRPLVQIALVGLPELEARLAKPELAQLRQRIAAHGRLQSLDADDTRHYVHHRVTAAGGDGPERFPRETCLEIHRHTRGVPRAINTLAGQALLAASRESERVVTLRHVQSAAADAWMHGVADGAPPASPAAQAPARPATESPRPRAKSESAEIAPATAPATPPVKESKPAAAAKTPPVPKPVASSKPKPEAEILPTAEPAAAPAPLPPRPAGDPEVRQWISRFVDPDKPLQIGVHAGLAPGTIEGFSDEALERGGDDEGAPAAPSPGPRAERRRVPMPARRRARRDSAILTTAGAAVLTIAAAVVIVPRLQRPAPLPAHSASAIATPGVPATPDSRAAPARRRDKTARHTPARTQAAPALAGPERLPASGAAADTVTAPKRWQGIEVATYLDPYRASAESARLAEITGLSSRVTEADDRSGEAYRVVLGSFGSRRKAERVADDLIGRGLIQQARIVQLGPIRPD